MPVIYLFCLPVYNVAPYIKDAINSILAQKLEKFNYEIICVDDASTDNSLQVLEEFQKIKAATFVSILMS